MPCAAVTRPPPRPYLVEVLDEALAELAHDFLHVHHTLQRRFFRPLCQDLLDVLGDVAGTCPATTPPGEPVSLYGPACSAL